ncbi:hypothetical protein BC828DRAFT_408148 [Blastocladiella britannica]|nr:hypothetical protein BC828DRAFT_408148 [Blastocladiella britannica]
MPRQRWYMTWTLVDIYFFFQAANDPCSAGGPALNVCAATFDERATAAQLDFSNSTFCNGPKEYQDTEQKYLTTLKTHPFRSTASDCVSGNVIEGDLGKCGYYTESGACFMRSSCPNLNVNVSSQCPMYITNFQNSYDPASTVPGTGTTSSSKTVAIVIGVGVAAVVVGLLMALMYSRRRSTDVQLKNTVTLARPGAPPAPTAPSAPVQLQQQQQPLLQQQQQQQQQQPAYPPAAAMQYQQQQPSGYSPVPQGYPATPVSQGYAMSPQGYAPPPGTQGYAAPPPQGYPMPQAQPVYAAAQATGQQQF